MHCVSINLFLEFSFLGLKFTIKPAETKFFFSVIILKVCCIFPPFSPLESNPMLPLYSTRPVCGTLLQILSRPSRGRDLPPEQIL